MYLAAWFSDMGWGEVVIALAPVFIAIWLIHRYEERVGTPAYSSLKPAAKGWLWLMGMRSSVAAKLMSKVESAQLRAYMAAGAELAPKADRHLVKVIREFAKSNPEMGIGGDDVLGAMGDFADEHPEDAVRAMMKLWPVEAVVEVSLGQRESAKVEVPSEQQNQAAAEAQKKTAAQAGEMAPLQPCAAPNLEPCAELKPIAVLEEEAEQVVR